MRLEQLRYLNEMSRNGSMRAVSEKMHISPQALSRSLKLLEQEIGQSLFLRTNQGSTLTDIGREIVKLSDPFIENLDMLIASYSHRETMEKYILYITPNFDDYFTAKIATYLRFKTMKASIEMQVLTEKQAKELLENNQVDFILGHIYKLNDCAVANHYSEYVYESLFSLRYGCCVSEKSVLSKRKYISLSSIFKQTIFNIDSTSNEEFMDFLQELNMNSKAVDVQFFSHYMVQNEALANDEGIYLVAEIPWKDVSQKQTIPHTTVIPIREKISLDMCLIYKKDKIFTKMSKDVIQEIKNYIQSILT